MKQVNPNLSNEQKAVLFGGDTEAPFTGALLENKDSGMYTCANCGAELFQSSNKYDSGSGWPSFDDALPGAVAARDDDSHGMIRTEIPVQTAARTWVTFFRTDLQKPPACATASIRFHWTSRKSKPIHPSDAMRLSSVSSHIPQSAS